MVATAETLSETKLCGSRRSTSTSSTPSVVKKSSSISSELGIRSTLIHKQAAEQEYPPRRKMVILLTPIPVVVVKSRREEKRWLRRVMKGLYGQAMIRQKLHLEQSGAVNLAVHQGMEMVLITTPIQVKAIILI